MKVLRKSVPLFHGSNLISLAEYKETAVRGDGKAGAKGEKVTVMTPTRKEIEADIVRQFTGEPEAGRAAFADGVIQGLKAAVQTVPGLCDQVALIELMESLKEQLQASATNPEPKK